MKREGSRWKRFLLSVIAVTLISAAVVGVIVLTNPVRPWMSQEEWSSTANVNLILSGVVTKFEQNYVSYGFTTYHVFHAAISINVTEIVWVSDEILDDEGRIYSWSNDSRIMIGYDFKELPNLAVGDLIDTGGYWEPRTDSAYSLKLTVAPNINGSYVKPLP